MTVLQTTLDTCHLVYNSLLNDRVFQYETAKASPSCYSQQKMLPAFSKAHPEVKAVHSQVLQNVAVRVDLAFKAFFRRVKAGETPGFPRMKGKDQYDSITYPQGGYSIGQSTVILSKIGQVKANWSMFRTVLTDKAESAGREVIGVDPRYTSQDCHACGYRAKKKLSERWHFCPNCSASLDRDTNAAINILNLGLNLCRTIQSQGKPVEAPPFMAGE